MPHDSDQRPHVPHLDEQWPLSPLDDYPIHQTDEPIRVVATSDVRFYDRHWLVGHSRSQDLMIVVGGSMYPNLDMAEAYAIVNYRGWHGAVRATRTLGPDRADLHVGPVKPTIVEGLRAWHYEVEQTPYGFSFALDYRDTIRQVARTPHPAGGVGDGHPRGRHRDTTGGFEGFGELSGWIEVEGVGRLEIAPGDGAATRDRHWGVRNGVGGPDQLFGARPPRGGNGHQFINLGTWALWADRVFYPYGHPNTMTKVVNIDRRMRFDPDSMLLREAVIDNTLSDGTVRRIEYHRREHMTAFLRCGFYGGPNGGAPGSDRWQGQLPAEQPIEGEGVDVSTPAGEMLLSGLNEHLCDAVCDGEQATGLVQTYDPNAYLRCKNGIPGWGLL